MDYQEIADLIEEGKQLLFSKYKLQDALKAFNKALKVSENNNLPCLTAKSLTGLGNTYRYLGKTKEALIALFQSNQILESINEESELAYNYLFIGIVYWQVGTYEKALDFYYKALAIHNSLNRITGIASCYNNIGLVYWHLNNHEKALEYFFKALNLKRQLDDEEGISITLSNIGNIYNDYQDFEKALQYHRESYEIDVKINRLYGIASGLNNIGSDLMKQKKYAEALNYLQKSLEKKQQLSDKIGEANTLKNIGKVHLGLQDYDKAKNFFLESIELAQETQANSVLRDTFNNLAKMYEDIGDLKSALQYYKQYEDKRNEIFSETSRKKISEIETNFEIERIEKQAQLIREKNQALNQEIEKRKQIEYDLRISEEKYRNLVETIEEGIFSFDEQKRVIYLNSAAAEIFGYKPDELIGTKFTELIISPIQEDVIFPDSKDETTRTEIEIYTGRKENKTIIISITPKYFNDMLISYFSVFFDITERKQTEIKLQSYKEHLRLINRILRHDILNALTVVNSSVRLYKHKQDVHLLESVESSVNKSVYLINQMRELENFLSEHQHLKTIEVDKVINQVSSTYTDIDITISGKAIALADEAFNSVIDNLISNAIVHGKTRQIDFQISHSGNYCRIDIFDFGIGIPDEIKEKIFEESFIYGETGKSGLGLYIVKQTIERYGGLIAVEDNHPKGAKFTILLKRVR
jgi:PAS domain S-box-containing protein